MAGLTPLSEGMKNWEEFYKFTWAKKVHGLNCKEISKEFSAKMRRYVAGGVTLDTCKIDANKFKCRYADVLCIDQTRLHLKERTGYSDFINANWVASPAPGSTKYICTQAPLKETMEDFWHLCFTEKVSLILMLCNFKEGTDLEKCSHYFPEKVGEMLQFGHYTVTMKETLDEPQLEDTDFSVMEIKCGSETMLMKHAFARFWIDNCAPVETKSVLDLWRWVRQHHENQPVVVHSSAGVGRAGCFVGIETAAYRISHNPDIHMLEIVKELRTKRHQAIQSHVQFLYLHCLVLDLFISEQAALPYTQSKFVDEYRRHTAKRMARVLRVTRDEAYED